MITDVGLGEGLGVSCPKDNSMHKLHVLDKTTTRERQGANNFDTTKFMNSPMPAYPLFLPFLTLLKLLETFHARLWAR